MEINIIVYGNMFFNSISQIYAQLLLFYINCFCDKNVYHIFYKYNKKKSIDYKVNDLN